MVTIVLVMVVSLILVVSGPVTTAIGNALGIGQVPQMIWSIVKWPVLLLVVVLIIAILYYAAPNAKQPKFRWVSLGSVVALVVLAVATLLFGLYVANFAHYARFYGPLAGVIVFLLWVWIANLALLFGAEFDAELERGRELQAGMPAEEQIQLPPRDTRQSEELAAKEDKVVGAARDFREERAREIDADQSAEQSGGQRADVSGRTTNQRR